MAPQPKDREQGKQLSPSGRVAIIGSGHVGATTAYALMLRALFSEIVLIDSDQAHAIAEARDIADANALARPARIWAGDYTDAAEASIVVMTAGAATHGSESRLSVAARSAAIVRQCAGQLAAAGFDGILLVAANPVDLMTMVALDCAGLPPGQVLGTGTLLDSSRLRALLAEELSVAASTVDALVLGEHGDSEVALFSAVRVGGISLAAFSAEAAGLDHHAIACLVRDAGYAIIAGKGYTSFGVATAIVRICEAIVRDERAILPVSSPLEGPPGLPGVCMSMPSIVGASGVARVLVPTMNDEEAASLAASAVKLDAAFREMQSDASRQSSGCGDRE